MLLQMKEWLCLNCQMQRASGPPKPPQPKPIKAPVLDPQQKDVQASLPNRSPQQGSKGDTSAKPVLSQTEASKNKGFELSHDKSTAPSPQPAASTESEKGLGFGSSIIITASDIMAPAVRDKASVKPPSRRKSSAASEASLISSTPSNLHKEAVDSKKDSSKDPKSVTQQPTSEEKISALQTTKEQSAEVKADSLSACPLCNDKFQNNPPNFNTCTSCKMTVCNLCGFNPMPDQSEVGPCKSPKYICLFIQIYTETITVYG